MRKKDGNFLVGLILVIVGAILLAENYNIMPDFIDLRRIWPVFVIIGGLLLMFRRH